jgi:hypothetical protein
MYGDWKGNFQDRLTCDLFNVCLRATEGHQVHLSTEQASMLGFVHEPHE